jgi:hypothetical protein
VVCDGGVTLCSNSCSDIGRLLRHLLDKVVVMLFSTYYFSVLGLVDLLKVLSPYFRAKS